MSDPRALVFHACANYVVSNLVHFDDLIEGSIQDLESSMDRQGNYSVLKVNFWVALEQFR